MNFRASGSGTSGSGKRGEGMPIGDEDTSEPLEPWQTLSAECPLVTPWYSIRRDRVRTHHGDEISYTYIDHPGAVFVVPATASGEVLLIRQYRYPVREWCWEVPAGGVEAGEDGAAAAARELAEELGAVSFHIRPVATFWASNGISNQRSQVYLADEVIVGQNRPERTELLRIVAVPQHEALRMAHAGEITDGQSALALLLCESYLRASIR
jgi:8-oxo-dGTP pyrophosphatase MutT (NUDIX family)